MSAPIDWAAVYGTDEADISERVWDGRGLSVDDTAAPASMDADGMVTITSGVTLDAEQLATVLGALADAATYRGADSLRSCDYCDAHAEPCGPHRDDLAAADEYGNLAARLLGGGAR